MYIGKIRFFVNVLGDNKFQLLEHDIFYDDFISSNRDSGEIEEAFSNDFQEISEKIFEKENIEPGNVFEVITDLFFETYKTYIPDYAVYEYDCLCFIENEKHIKLTEEQIKNMD
jgi:hypothetical protein